MLSPASRSLVISSTVSVKKTSQPTAAAHTRPSPYLSFFENHYSFSTASFFKYSIPRLISVLVTILENMYLVYLFTTSPGPFLYLSAFYSTIRLGALPTAIYCYWPCSEDWSWLPGAPGNIEFWGFWLWFVGYCWTTTYF